MTGMKKRAIIGIAFLVLFCGGNLSFADSKEIARDGVYVAYENGIVRDTGTGLEWVAGPDKDTPWEEAKSWVETLNIGKGWRMPKMGELEGLYKQGLGDRNMTPLLKTNGWWVWSEDYKEGSFNYIAWNFGFYLGIGRWGCAREATDRRAFAVRPIAK